MRTGHKWNENVTVRNSMNLPTESDESRLVQRQPVVQSKGSIETSDYRKVAHPNQPRAKF